MAPGGSADLKEDYAQRFLGWWGARVGWTEKYRELYHLPAHFFST